jgi:hypothetical protein
MRLPHGNGTLKTKIVVQFVNLPFNHLALAARLQAMNVFPYKDNAHITFIYTVFSNGQNRARQKTVPCAEKSGSLRIDQISAHLYFAFYMQMTHQSTNEIKIKSKNIILFK